MGLNHGIFAKVFVLVYRLKFTKKDVWGAVLQFIPYLQLSIIIY